LAKPKSRRTPTKQTPYVQKSKPAHPRRAPVERKPAPKPGLTWKSLSPERKLDILGVFLALVGLLTAISLLTKQPGTLTKWWVDFVYGAVGWGAFVLPLALIGIGLWLVFRHIEKLPSLSIERLIGILFVFLNLLSWLSLISDRWQIGANYGGGGIGSFFERLLIVGLGSAGALVVLFAWLIVALTMTFDLSVMDIVLLLKPFWLRLQRAWKSRRMLAKVKTDDSEELAVEEELPSTFKRLEPIRPSNKRESMVEPAQGKKQTALVKPQPSTLAQIVPTQVKAKAPETPWKLPDPIEILEQPTPVAVQESFDQDTAHLIEETLVSFGVPGHIVDIQHGPTFTQFGLEPDFIESRHGRTRVRVNKITALADDLALALAAERIRIQAPVPGRNYVGIEVPNPEISRVTLIEVMESTAFKRMRSSLRFALGKNVSGKPVAVDMTALPHLLIAGTTGSGKSVCINSILCSLLLNNTPADLRLVLVDPKRVELTGYNGIPQLLSPVVTNTDQVVNALQWITREMDSRYHKFNKSGVRNIQEYNQKEPANHLPYLVIIIDELADLMMLAPDETERAITRLAQLARATGIHLILATQRPSTDVVTGLIKANFPARIAFAVASGVDSRVILDQPGAERLLGRGDMLYQAPDASGPVRLQGVYVSDMEIQRLVDYWRNAALNIGTRPEAEEIRVDDLPRGVPLKQEALWDNEAADDEDPLLKEAIDLIRREGRASITMLQRRMRIGYTRAARLIDIMEDKGIVSPVQPNTQVREVLDYGPAIPPPEDN
jgi:DNA segregation ATPase FtsK/SpoIIIE, S-DNA-T family